MSMHTLALYTFSDLIFPCRGNELCAVFGRSIIATTSSAQPGPLVVGNSTHLVELELPQLRTTEAVVLENRWH